MKITTTTLALLLTALTPLVAQGTPSDPAPEPHTQSTGDGSGDGSTGEPAGEQSADDSSTGSEPAEQDPEAADAKPEARSTEQDPRSAREDAAAVPASFDAVMQRTERKLETALQELDALRERIADEKIPLARQLRELEGELLQVRQDYRSRTRLLDSRTLDLSQLTKEIRQREDEQKYLSNLLGETIRNFETRIHIVEEQLYGDQIDSALEAVGNDNLTAREVYTLQADLVESMFDRLEQLAGGQRFEGTAADQRGVVQQGTFALLGPAALFAAGEGDDVGVAAEQRNSVGPRIQPLPEEATRETAREFVQSGEGRFVFDPTQGQAFDIAQTSETVVEHIEKGGIVAYVILAMAALVLLVVLYRWFVLSLQGRPSRKQVRKLLEAVGRNDREAAQSSAKRMRGPTGRMLEVGVDHLRYPRELIEEVMYEKVLTTRMKLNRMLPFIAICAAAAPLLGLLGTVVGIIETFKLITVFGSGDVSTLSSGISAALITTELGLIVAIPSLMLHAYLSRKARAIIGHMETTAVAFMNQLQKAPRSTAKTGSDSGEADPELVRMQVREILSDMLGPLAIANGNGNGVRAQSS